MFGCEFDTVGKALWDVVLCSRRSNPDFAADAGVQEGGEKKDVDEAFWAWVKETLRSGLEEGDEDEEDEHELEEVEEVDEEALSDSDGQEIEEPSSKHLELGGVPVTLERVGDTPDETLRELTVGFAANKSINRVD